MTSSITYSNSLLFTIPVVDILSWFGKRADHRGYMYYSPFRDEAEPSMRVTVNPSSGTWMWADFGGSPEHGKKADGGGCLDMVRRLGNFSSDEEAFAELRKIASSRGLAVIEEESRKERVRAAKPSGVVVDDVNMRFTRRNLIKYAGEQRGIPESLLSRYCRQVTYHPRSNGTRHFTVIGFPNNAGGYALRGTGPSKTSKRNTESGITTIAADGSFRPDGSAWPHSELAPGKCQGQPVRTTHLRLELHRRAARRLYAGARGRPGVFRLQRGPFRECIPVRHQDARFRRRRPAGQSLRASFLSIRGDWRISCKL